MTNSFGYLLFLLLSWADARLMAQPAKIHDVLVMPFGRTNQISYTLKTGTADVTYSRTNIIIGAFAAARTDVMELTSKQYTNRQTTKNTFRDAFGIGIRYVITLTGSRLPTMQQVFYTYQDNSYFFTEVSLSG